MTVAETTLLEPSPTRSRVARLSRRLRPVHVLDAVVVLVCLWATLRATQGKFLWLDTNFDLRYYHAYNGWSLFSGGLNNDLHPAGGGSYYSPYLDALTYFSYSIVPARLGSSLILAVQLSGVIPLYLIARRVMPEWRRSFAIGTAVLAMGGATVTSEWGTTFGDLTSAPTVIWAVAVLLNPQPRQRLRPVLAGVLLGAGLALKLTNAPFIIAGTALALYVLLPKVLPFLQYALAGLVGYFVVAGPWMWVVARETSNPVFPLYNNVFTSPYYPVSGASDGRFAAFGMGFGESLMLPFKFVAAPAFLTGELPFSEWRWAIWAVSVVVLAVLVLLQLPGSPLAKASLPDAWRAGESSMRALIGLNLFVVVAFLVWANFLGLARYGLAIEILAVPAIVGLLSRLTTRDVGLAAMVGCLALGLGWNTLTMDWGRIPMPSGRAITPGSVTALQAYDTIVVADTQPLSYVPAAVGGRVENDNRPVWLGKPFTEPDRQRGLERLRPGRVGVLVRLDYGDTLAFAQAAAEWYGLPAPRACDPVSVPLGDPIAICPVGGAPRP